MSIVIEDARLEQLAKQLAKAEGTTIEGVVRTGLLSLAGQRGLNLSDLSLHDRLAVLAREVDAIPSQQPHDQRTADEVLGYDAHGRW